MFMTLTLARELDSVVNTVEMIPNKERTFIRK